MKLGSSGHTMALGLACLLLHGATSRAEELPPETPDQAQPSSRHGIIRELGDWGQYFNPAVAALITLSEGDGEGLRELAKGCLITVGGTSLLKRVFQWTPLGERPSGGKHSFPSGHAAAAMCAPAFVHERYERAGYTAPLFATGSFVAYSRVWAWKHHWHDVAASTVFAMVVAHNTTESRDRDDEKRAARRVGIEDSALGSSLQVPTAAMFPIAAFRSSPFEASGDPLPPRERLGWKMIAGLEIETRPSLGAQSQTYIGFRTVGTF